MAYSRVVLEGDGTTTDFAVNFALDFLLEADVTCRVGTEADGLGDPIYRAITFLATNLINIGGAVVADGVRIVFKRTVDKAVLRVDYNNGDQLDEDNLMIAQKQAMMAVHEVLDGRFSVLTQDLDFGGFTGVNLREPTATSDAATKLYVDGFAGPAAAINAAASAAAAAASALLTADDRIQTGLDRVQTGIDRATVAADRVQTGLDRADAATSATSAAASAAVSATTLVATVATLAAAAAATIPVGIELVTTLGRVSSGDNGGGTYTRIAPSTPAAWRFQSADGQWWALNNRTVTPEMFGAVGDGATDCTAVFTNLATWLNLPGVRSATVNFKHGANYAIWPAATTPAIILQLTDCIGSTINFNGAKLTTDNLFVPQGSPYIFVIGSGSGITINDPWYVQTAFTTLTFLKGAHFIYINGASTSNIIVNNGRMTGGVAYFTATGAFDGSYNTSGIQLNNAKLNSLYYGINCQGEGDNLAATGIECTNVARSYFAYNVSNHKVELIGTGGAAHDWVLLKCYAYPGRASNVLSNIDVTIRSRGQNGTSGVTWARSLVALAMQQSAAPMTVSAVSDNGSGKVRLTVNSTAALSSGNTPLYFAGLAGWATINGTKQVATKINATTIDLLAVNYAGGYTSGGTISYLAEIRNIKVHYDVEDANGNGNPVAINTQKHDYVDATDTTTRGYTIENVELSGSLKGYDYSIPVIDLFNNTGGSYSLGTWSGETLRNIGLHDLIISGTSGTVSINATNISSLQMENIWSSPAIPWTLTGAFSNTRITTVSASGITDLPRVAAATPANPATTSSVAPGVMMGLGASCLITPTNSGRVMLSFSGNYYNNVNTNACQLSVRYGTGAAPANGAAVAGTLAGAATIGGMFGISMSVIYGLTRIITGLTPGVPYWFDIQLGVFTSGTVGLQATSFTAVEI